MGVVALLTSSAVVTLAAGSAADDCPDVAIVGARGSTDTVTTTNRGMGTNADYFADSLERELTARYGGALAVQSLAVAHSPTSIGVLTPTRSELTALADPARRDAAMERYRTGNLATYTRSVDQGMTSAVEQMTALHTRCAGTTFVLAGYSQGAMALHGALARLADDGRTALLSRVAATVLVADGDRVAQTAATRRGTAAATAQGVRTALQPGGRDVAATPPVLDLCLARDLACDFDAARLLHRGVSPSLSALKEASRIHTGTGYRPLLLQAAQEIATSPLLAPTSTPTTTAPTTTAPTATTSSPTTTAPPTTTTPTTTPTTTAPTTTAVPTATPPAGSAALAAFRAARADSAAGRGPLDVVVVGDSVTEGRDVGKGNRWVDVLLRLLRDRYQPAGVPGGEGYVPAYYAAGGMADRFTFGGTPTLGSQYGFGMRANHMPSGVGNSMATTFTGTSFELHYASSRNTGTVTVSVDGGPGTPVSTTGSDWTPRDGGSWTSPPLPRGTHTVTLTNTSGRTVLVEGISVYDGDEAAGVRLWEAGHSGWQAEDYAHRPTAPQHGQAVAAAAPHLVVVALGYNDVVAGFSAADFRGYLTTTIAHLLGPDAGPDPSVLVVGYPPRTDVPAAAWDAYLEAMAGVAAEQGHAFADLSDLPQFGMSGDGVHPTATGHAQLAAALDAYLAAG
ncbi:GDSL-type esterase/lipase family protein [Blastococcus sp. MG754427]|uniref:GDSL-type esterase/lipase family protein n=1 Tax=Blastococcus sp. MG754427 TaxID=2570318 RepID=UPI001F2CB1B0|nr:GDSL-type esterase/lipase family protein [Blastococcus sp. MG754427]